MIWAIPAHTGTAPSPDEADCRRTLLNLTASGDQLLNELVPPAERIDEQLLEALPDAERSLAVGILRKIAYLDHDLAGSNAGAAS
ncbi:hypothetical protein [Streptomyces sp. NRRL B-24484]|uniref:hypothetical protein n=1 Tax=Streptomyces sp. NRRL B-24484 TaxID=1463833 RepID=UPI001331AEBC|nr:hypothetical protein [Streptomyces sp. NRRL B-24484]